MPYLWRSWVVPNDFKHTEASFLPNSMDSLYLRVARMPRSRDLVIFVPPPTMTDKTNCFTPCACARGNDVSHRGMYTVDQLTRELSLAKSACISLACVG